MFDVLRTQLASDVADAGTFAVSYPEGRGAGSYSGGTGHGIHSFAYGALTVAAGAISISFGASTATITNNSGQTLAAGTDLVVQLDRFGPDDDVVEGEVLADAGVMAGIGAYVINLGAPATADADGAVASQAATLADGLATGINGALAADGVATFDVPRNVVAAWTNTAVLTVTGTDVYGNVVVESSASGTSLTGKKAFKTVTGIAVSANVTGLTVGSGVLLGLPVALAGTGYVLKEIMDGAAATAGTTVAAVTGTQTATTGDVRGTYSPNSAPNGSRAYQLIAALDAPGYRGLPQFAG